MKNIYQIFILLFVITITGKISAQNITEFTSNLTKGDVPMMAQQLDDNVEITILNNNTYNKEDAQTILDNFFVGKNESTYKAVHRGSTDNKDAYYQIGELMTQSENYRTYVFTKKVAGDFLIQELRIEKL